MNDVACRVICGRTTQSVCSKHGAAIDQPAAVGTPESKEITSIRCTDFYAHGAYRECFLFCARDSDCAVQVARRKQSDFFVKSNVNAVCEMAVFCEQSA